MSIFLSERRRSKWAMRARLRSASVAAGILGSSALLVWVLVEAFGGERVVARLLFWGFVLVAWLVVSVVVAVGLGAVIRLADSEDTEAAPTREAA